MWHQKIHAIFEYGVKLKNRKRFRQGEKYERDARCECGMVSAEFALTIPLFLAVVLFMLSAVMQAANIGLVSDGAREAARAYSLGQSAQDATEIAKNIVGENAQVKIRQNADVANVEVIKPGTGFFALIDYDFTAKHSVVLEP